MQMLIVNRYNICESEAIDGKAKILKYFKDSEIDIGDFKPMAAVTARGYDDEESSYIIFD